LRSLLPLTANSRTSTNSTGDGRNSQGKFVATEGSYTLQLIGVDSGTGLNFVRKTTVMV
jgi:hypothetical protein